jgi:O-antigen/teichoic acid export membrane protein
MSAAFAASGVARAAIAFVTSVIVARGLGPDGFGRWTLFMAWASALTVAFDLGLSTLITREAARARGAAGSLVIAAAASRLTLFAPAAAAVLIGWPLVREGEQAAAVLIVVLAAVGLAYGCMAAVFRASPIWVGGVLGIETASALAQSAGAALIVVRSAGGVIGLLQLAVSVQAAQLLAALVLWRIAQPDAALEWRAVANAPSMLKRALPFAASGLIANAQGRVAPLLLGALATPAELGAFDVASRLGGAARVFPHAGFSAALPVLASEAAQGDPQPLRLRLDEVLRWFSIGAAGILALFAAPLIAWTYGASFAGAAPALVWTAAGLVPALLNGSRKVYLYATGGERHVVRWTSVALVAQSVGCAALVPAFGAAGAAAAMTLGEAAIWWPLKRAAGYEGVGFARRTPRTARTNLSRT